MLFVVLVLVVIAFGLLIATLVLHQTLLAWVSVGISALAAVLLIIDAIRRSRARHRARQAAPPVRQPAEPQPLDVDYDEQDPFAPALPADGRHARPDEERRDDLTPADEPDVEQTDPADLAILADLDEEVVVVDERPRYHLDSCSWLGDRPVVPLPVYEARELGFTPCAICAPDAELLATARDGA